MVDPASSNGSNGVQGKSAAGERGGKGLSAGPGTIYRKAYSLVDGGSSLDQPATSEG